LGTETNFFKLKAELEMKPVVKSVKLDQF